MKVFGVSYVGVVQIPKHFAIVFTVGQFKNDICWMMIKTFWEQYRFIGLLDTKVPLGLFPMLNNPIKREVLCDILDV